MTAPPATRDRDDARRVRVLHLITTLDRGGAENALLHLCRAFATGPRARRHEVRVAWLKGRGELARDFNACGVPASRFGRRAFAEFRPDVVHTHLFKADVAGAALVGRRRRGRALLVSTKHNEDRYLVGHGIRPSTWRALARRVARRADAVVAISRGVADFCARVLGDAGPAPTVIPYGLPTPRKVDAKEAAAFRSRVGVPAGASLVLCAARLDRQKDPATLIRAVARIAPERAAHLVLAGRGPLADELRALAEVTPAARTTFAGFLEDPAPAYAAADVVALASRWEGLGLALVEAMQYGRPVVATHVGGIPEVVDDGRTGLLVPPGEPIALADALSRVLGDPAAARRMGERGRARAAETFSLERRTDEVEELYARLAEERT